MDSAMSGSGNLAGRQITARMLTERNIWWKMFWWLQVLSEKFASKINSLQSIYNWVSVKGGNTLINHTHATMAMHKGTNNIITLWSLYLKSQWYICQKWPKILKKWRLQFESRRSNILFMHFRVLGQLCELFSF